MLKNSCLSKLQPKPYLQLYSSTDFSFSYFRFFPKKTQSKELLCNLNSRLNLKPLHNISDGTKFSVNLMGLIFLHKRNFCQELTKWLETQFLYVFNKSSTRKKIYLKKKLCFGEQILYSFTTYYTI